jgi:predicted metalloprotease with PDZ domain
LVLAVAPSSPAATAGLREGDALLAIDGAPVSSAGAEARGSYRRIAAIVAQIDRAASDGHLALQVRRGTQVHMFDITLEFGCPSRFQTKVSDVVDSEAYLALALEGFSIPVTVPTSEVDIITDQH